MSNRTQWIIVGVVVAALGLGLYAATRAFGDDLFRWRRVRGARVPRHPPWCPGATKLKNISDYRGQVVLLNLWATWCGPCKAGDAGHPGAA